MVFKQRNQTKQKPIEIPVGIQKNLTELEKETNDQSAKVKAEPINIKAMLSEKAEDIKEKVKDIVSKASTWTKENLIPFLAGLKTTYEDIKEKLSESIGENVDVNIRITDTYNI